MRDQSTNRTLYMCKPDSAHDGPSQTDEEKQTNTDVDMGVSG